MDQYLDWLYYRLLKAEKEGDEQEAKAVNLEIQRYWDSLANSIAA